MISTSDKGQPEQINVETRARASGGASSELIYEMVARAIVARHPGGGVLVDVGCGGGKLWDFVGDRFDRFAKEHLENPRAFMRELVRLTKPGGWALVTTPNQLSLLSKMTLVLKNQFNAFQEAPGCYPAHITALLEIDLIRIATEVV